MRGETPGTRRIAGMVFVDLTTKRPPEVWVLNPKQLSAYIAREPVALKREDVAFVSSRIINDMQRQ